MAIDFNKVNSMSDKQIIDWANRKDEEYFEEPMHYDDEEYDEHEEDYVKGGDELDMVKQNLFQLSVYAAKLHDMLDEGHDVEEWVQEKIVEATSKISDVYHYLEYQAYKNSK